MSVEKWTENQLRKLERDITTLYKDAYSELKEKVHDYYYGYTDSDGDHFNGFYDRYIKELNAYENGIYTEEQFNAWIASQEGRGNYFKALRDQFADRMTNANVIASDMINKHNVKVFVKNANSVTNIVQKASIEEGVLGIRFDILDEHTVEGLFTGEINVFKKAVDIPKDLQWNRDKLTKALTQSILQGEDYKKLANRFEAIAGMNRSSAIRNARTSTTSAQNAGKVNRYRYLHKQGVELTKIWVDVHDSVPPERPEHWEASGQEVSVDEPFIVGGEELMYPADPNGSGWNIYNCRCTMRTGKPRFKSILTREQSERANIRVL